MYMYMYLYIYIYICTHTDIHKSSIRAFCGFVRDLGGLIWAYKGFIGFCRYVLGQDKGLHRDLSDIYSDL